MATSAPSPDAAAAQVTTASPPPEYTGDAASRVFDVTELLEHILLLAVASQSDEANNKDSKILKMPLIPGCGNVSKGGICLFGIQRVSKTFRHTIHGSTKLKQLIYLAPPSIDTPVLWEDEDSEGIWPPAYHPLQSLVSLLNANVEGGFLDFLFVCKWDGEKTLVTIMSPLFIHECESSYEQIIGHLPNGWHNPEASWRSIKICNAKEPSPFKYSFWSSLEGDDDAPPFPHSCQLGEDATLEYVFELYSIVLKVLDEYVPKKILMKNEFKAAYDKLVSNWADASCQVNTEVRDDPYSMWKQNSENVSAMTREREGVIERRTSEFGKGKGI